MKNRNIRSFQSLRLIAFLVVFMVHLGKYRIIPLANSGRYAVVLFIMLGGFLYGFNSEKYQSYSVYSFIKNKIINIWRCMLYLYC